MINKPAQTFLDALRFLTVLPLPKAEQEPDLPKAMFFFPLAGLIIGFLSLLVYFTAQFFLSERLCVLILLIAPVFLSGGLHLDGLADFCDGYFGGKSRERKLEIMKDSRIGTWGAAAIALSLLVKFELLSALPAKAPLFLLMLACSRWLQVFLSFLLPYIGKPGGLAEGVALKITSHTLLGASLWLLPVILFSGIPGMAAFLGFAGFAFGIFLFYKKEMGGITGDMIGAASEISEIVILIFAAGVLHA